MYVNVPSSLGPAVAISTPSSYIVIRSTYVPSFSSANLNTPLITEDSD